MFWQRAQGNLQLPAGHFGCSVSKIMQIKRWTAARSWFECGLEQGSSFMGWTGHKLCCKCTLEYMVLNHLQKLLEFGKACCRFTYTSVGSTFVVVASFRYSSCGPSTTYLGIKTSCVLQVRKSWIVEGSGSGRRCGHPHISSCVNFCRM